MLPHSFIFGHLLAVGKAMAKYPPGLNGGYLPFIMAKEYPELEVPGIMYLDMWPISPPMLTVFNPDMMAAFTQEPSLPKHPHLLAEFKPFTDLKDILTLSGAEWKRWRGIFNPAFSYKNILSLVPAFLEEIDVFLDYLKESAESGDIIRLEEKATLCTIDIIGRAVCNVRFHAQSSRNILFETLIKQINLLWISNAPDHLINGLNPLRPYRMKRNNKIMKDILTPHIESEVQKQLNGENPEYKTIISLASKAYLTEQSSSTSQKAQIDQEFIDTVVSQIKVFLLAGHDTTASGMAYAYYLLHKNPDVLAKMREEHDSVFGTDTSTARAQIACDPVLLNKLPYTIAFIKEVLRIFPPVGTIREGQKDHFLTHPETGQKFPTDGMMIFGVSFAVQRDPKYFPRPEEVIPERWFAKEGEPLHVQKNTWRPFELGPRNCIGQELAQVELRAILAMTVRDLDIEICYPEDSPSVFGTQAYQTLHVGQVTGHPHLGMPARVKKRVNVK
ncbi:hypothetical protein N7478_009811 [Penicillium angulare]|uniref:uncharacterized protein n=1 Tax=Penicillium angulare TaxID=116970 RepID=UPI002540C62A|nr:uncharacterized protein N7478_009811 [Penicillium angulare]KAJ5267003.1 hypothetical protein N7478_009811 [Penicillium angulare]